ncbi:hypothetical protein TRIUR3_01386 [Triticum urartu]|uniref:Uncharacterized protein n=1 Tax=Triticum urartu TaxID=4572 RepID=M7Z0A2_TRIUA|nr:hypothetical protein TRIUR3_01386 [Triticum urartu]
MKITDVDMKIEALTNYINLRRVGGEGGSMNVGNKKTKKKIFRVPQDELDEILLYQAAPAPAWQSAAKRYPWVVAEMEKIKVGFLAGQDKMRRQYEALGYATFEAEVTDDEQEEDAAVTTPYQDKDETLTTSFHERNDDAAVTTPYKENLEKDETSAASFHEKNDDAQAAAVTTPYKEKDETSAASFHEENDGRGRFRKKEIQIEEDLKGSEVAVEGAVGGRRRAGAGGVAVGVVRLSWGWMEIWLHGSSCLPCPVLRGEERRKKKKQQ